jgi:hypothetical protein
MNVEGNKIFEVLGLTGLSEQQRISFLPVLQEEMEIRVGNMLSRGLNDKQLKEFENIIDGSADQSLRWLESNLPDYKSNKEFWALQKKGLRGDDIINEMASSMWLKQNCPDYIQVVKICQEEMRNELNQYKEFFCQI